MKIFITGGGGFLGYRLALRLLDGKTLAGPDGKPSAISGRPATGPWSRRRSPEVRPKGQKPTSAEH